jgi:hypothetical protein
MPAKTIVHVTFDYEKETPGTLRYAEITNEDRGVIGTLYIRKDVAETLGREGLLVTIESV